MHSLDFYASVLMRIGRSLRKKSSKDVAFPHPKARKDKYRNEDKPGSGRVVWNLVKRTVNITSYRDGKNNVNPAKNRPFGCFLHDQLSSFYSLLLCRLRRPVRRFNIELLGVLCIQLLPAAELYGLGANHASNGSSAEKAIQNIETNVPSGSTHGDEAVTDVGPQRQSRPATTGLELPPHFEPAPFVLQRVRSVGARHLCLGNVQRRRSHRGEPHHGSSRSEVPIGIEGRPFAQMRWVGQRLPDFFRRVAQFPDENERPLLSILLYLRPVGRTRCV